MKLSRYGFILGSLDICWYDTWEKKFGVEIYWKEKKLISIGF